MRNALPLVTGLTVLVFATGCKKETPPPPATVAVPAAPNAQQPTPPAAPASTPAPSASPAQASQDVTDYLRWLQQFESSRQTYNQKTDQALMALQSSLMGAPGGGAAPGGGGDATKAVSDTIQRMGTELQQMQTTFRQKKAPPACQTLATAYDNYLAAAVNEAGSMAQALGQVQGGGASNPNLLNDLMRQQKEEASGQSPRQQLLRQVNAELQTVRAATPGLPTDLTGWTFAR